MTTTERIDAILKERGMSRRQLAIEAGIPTSSFQAAMARGKNLTTEMLQAVATSLDVPAAYLLGERCSVFTDDIKSTFISRMLSEMVNSNVSDIKEALTSAPYDEVRYSRPLTTAVAERIADELGVTLDYLTGRTDDPEESIVSLSLGDVDLEFNIQLADDELVECVHRICGMERKNIPLDYASDQIREVWDPRKIRVVMQYLNDSATILQKLLKLDDAHEDP